MGTEVYMLHCCVAECSVVLHCGTLAVSLILKTAVDLFDFERLYGACIRQVQRIKKDANAPPVNQRDCHNVYRQAPEHQVALRFRTAAN